MNRRKHRARIQSAIWMPWYEFSCILGAWQDVANDLDGLARIGGGVVVATVIAAVLLPALLVPLMIGGGLATTAVLTYATPDGRRLVAGLRAAGLPGPRRLAALAAGMAADDLHTLWYGRPHSAALLPASEDAEPGHTLPPVLTLQVVGIENGRALLAVEGGQANDAHATAAGSGRDLGILPGADQAGSVDAGANEPAQRGRMGASQLLPALDPGRPRDRSWRDAGTDNGYPTDLATTALRDRAPRPQAVRRRRLAGWKINDRCAGELRGGRGHE